MIDCAWLSLDALESGAPIRCAVRRWSGLSVSATRSGLVEPTNQGTGAGQMRSGVMLKRPSPSFTETKQPLDNARSVTAKKPSSVRAQAMYKKRQIQSKIKTGGRVVESWCMRCGACELWRRSASSCQSTGLSSRRYLWISPHPLLDEVEKLSPWHDAAMPRGLSFGIPRVSSSSFLFRQFMLHSFHYST